MSDSVSKYFNDLQDKAWWAAKESKKQNKNRFSKIISFIAKLFNQK